MRIGGWLIFFAAVFLSGCTTAVYEGPTKPANEVAVIESDRTMVKEIDGKSVPYSGGNYARFVVLPGMHSVTAALNDNSSYPRTRYSLQDQTVTFRAEPGETYVTRPYYLADKWSLQIAPKDIPGKKKLKSEGEFCTYDIQCEGVEMKCVAGRCQK